MTLFCNKRITFIYFLIFIDLSPHLFLFLSLSLSLSLSLFLIFVFSFYFFKLFYLKSWKAKTVLKLSKILTLFYLFIFSPKRHVSVIFFNNDRHVSLLLINSCFNMVSEKWYSLLLSSGKFIFSFFFFVHGFL